MKTFFNLVVIIILSMSGLPLSHASSDGVTEESAVATPPHCVDFSGSYKAVECNEVGALDDEIQIITLGCDLIYLPGDGMQLQFRPGQIVSQSRSNETVIGGSISENWKNTLSNQAEWVAGGTELKLYIDSVDESLNSSTNELERYLSKIEASLRNEKDLMRLTVNGTNARPDGSTESFSASCDYKLEKQ